MNKSRKSLRQSSKKQPDTSGQQSPASDVSKTSRWQEFLNKHSAEQTKNSEGNQYEKKKISK